MTKGLDDLWNKEKGQFDGMLCQDSMGILQ